MQIVCIQEPGGLAEPGGLREPGGLEEPGGLKEPGGLELFQMFLSDNALCAWMNTSALL